MSKMPVSTSAVLQFNSLINETHQLLNEARSGNDLPGKLAEAENRLGRIQAMLCPIMIVS